MSLIENILFFRKIVFLMGGVFSIHNGSLVHASNLNMEIEEQCSKAPQIQDVDEFFSKKNLWQDSGFFSPADMKDPQLKIKKHMNLSKKYTEKGDFLSKEEK